MRSCDIGIVSRIKNSVLSFMGYSWHIKCDWDLRSCIYNRVLKDHEVQTVFAVDKFIAN